MNNLYFQIKALFDQNQWSQKASFQGYVMELYRPQSPTDIADIATQCTFVWNGYTLYN